jgi:uncharacterized protein (UPF0332 family)
VKIRFDRAIETFDEANYLLQNNHFSGCVNRLYFSCFHCIQALFIKEELVAKSHSGTIKLFNQSFIRTGKFAAKNGKFLNNIFAKRLESDYGNFLDIDTNEITLYVAETRNFLHRTRKFLDLDK